MIKKIKVIPLLLSLIAGMGHLWEGKDLKGLLLFAIFATGLAGMFEGAVLWSGPGKAQIIWGSGFLVVCVWGYTFFDIIRLTYGPWQEKVRLKRKEHLRRGILCFLRDDFDSAEREFMANLRLEPGDPESLFRLAVISRIRGESGKARRFLRALRRTDLDQKWRWESSREQELIRRAERRKKQEAQAQKEKQKMEAKQKPTTEKQSV